MGRSGFWFLARSSLNAFSGELSTHSHCISSKRPRTESIPLLPSDEHRVIQQVVDGETELFRILVERYQRSLFRFVASLVIDQHQSEDITQEVFLSAYRNLRRFDVRRASFSTWLFTIARNQCINWLHRKRPMPARVLRPVGIPGLRTGRTYGGNVPRL